MTFLEFVRNKGYWFVDCIKGSKVKSFLKVLREFEEIGVAENDLEKYKNLRLKELLSHTHKTVPFYNNISSMDINDWPVIDKTQIRDNYNKFLSSDYSKDSLITMSTSGSTGTPFVSYQDANKKKHVNAETIFYNSKVGFEIGKKIIYFRSIVGEVKKSKLQQFLQNICLIDCMDLSDDGIRKNLDIISKNTRHSPAMVMGYASTFDAFARFFQRYGDDLAKKCDVYGMVSGSEMLNDGTRKTLEKAFDCKCVSRYANEENGFLGQDEDVNNEFLNNRASYYIEILKFDSDIPVDKGEIGRIVVTDYFNFAMPLIRYDTGDTGTWKRYQKNGIKRSVIASFGGRRIDQIYDCDGDPVSGFSITNLMWSYPLVIQYQFIQKGKNRYDMRLNVGNNKIKEKELLADLQKIVGKEAIIKLQYVDEIPVLASGKRKYIVNDMAT